MSKKDLYIYGAAYPDILKLINAINKITPTWRIAGFIDDTKQATDYLGFPILGGKEKLEQLVGESHYFINNIGSSTNARRAVGSLMEKAGCQFATLIHPSVDISLATIGEGTIISDGAIIGGCVEIGKHCAIRVNSVVNHDNVIGDYVFVGPGAVTCGYVTVKDGAYLGAGSVIKERILIEANTLIGAGAVVVKDVKPDTCVVGIPARPYDRK